MAPLQPAYLDIPLVGTKQSTDPRTAPLDGAYLLENYTIERTGAARKRHGLASLFATLTGVSRLYSQGRGTTRCELANGTYLLQTGSSTTDESILFDAHTLGRPLMPAPPITTIVQQSQPTSLVTDCNTYVARTASFIVVVTQEFLTASTILAAVYSSDGQSLLPAAEIPFFSGGSAPLRVSVVAGDGDDVGIITYDGATTKLIGLRVGSGTGGLKVSQLHTTTVASAVMEDACRGPGGTVIIGTLSGTNVALSVRRVSDGVAVASLNLASASGNATRFAINVGTTLSRAAAVVCGTVGASNGRSYLLSLTSSTMTILATGPSTLPNPAAAVGLSTIVVDEGATGTTTSHIVTVVDNLAAIGSVSTGPVLIASQISAVGASTGRVELAGYVPACKGYSPTPGACALPLVCLDYRAVGAAGVSIAGASVQPYGYGYVVADLMHRGSTTSSGIDQFTPYFFVRSWHAPGRGVRLSSTARLANYASIPGSTEGVMLCLTAFDRASSAAVESVRAVVIKTPPPPGAQALETRRTPSTAEASPATTLLAGGALTALHGTDTRPAADLHPADVVSITGIGGGGTWGGTSISVRGRFMWIDSAGFEITSAWSLPATVGVTASTAALDVELRLPLYLSACCRTRPHLQIAVAVGTSKTFVQALIEPAPGAPLTATVPAFRTSLLTQTVRLTPAGITSAVIDTASLANVMPPPPKYVSVGRQRAFTVSAEDERIYYSKPLVKGILPEWALELTLEPPPSIGTALAAEELGDKIVVLGSSGACYFLGDGQDANGDGSPYAGPYEALSGLGCDSVESVVSTPIGIFYRSQHTIVMIDEALKAVPLGREVFDVLAANPFTLRAQYYERSNSALWLLSATSGDRTLLTLNLSTMAWSVWQGEPTEVVVEDVVVSGPLLYAVAAGLTSHFCVYEDESEAHDGYDLDGIYVRGRLVTPYIRLEQIQKFQRLWHVQALVDAKVPGNTLALTIYRDGKPGGTLIATKTLASAGVQPVDYHIPAQLQRCSSVRLEFTDGQTGPASSTRTCGVDILGITLEIGIKRGLRGVPAAQRA